MIPMTKYSNSWHKDVNGPNIHKINLPLNSLDDRLRDSQTREEGMLSRVELV